MTPTSGSRGPSSSAKSYLLTLMGEFVLPNEGAAWTATLIEAMDRLGFGERNTRQALSRLASDGVFDVEHHGRRARWRLSAEGRQLLSAGADRIYRFGRRSRTWEGTWLVVLCSVPEAQRASRRRFQTQMAFAGFGTIGPGIVVSPHVDAEEEINRILRSLDLAEPAMVFVAETGTILPDEELLGRAWDLDDLADRYRCFLDDFSLVDPADPTGEFDVLTSLVHRWRRFPFIDPEIPVQLLPEDWPGLKAQALFAERREAWLPGATKYYLGLEEASG